jgi:hypothetical protein
MGSSTAHNTIGLHCLSQRSLYFFGVVFIMYNVSLIICVALFAVFCLIVVCYFV